jgi:catechol 2,3-dioxygenase-like lactoylglutathione lyase family enzyme
MSRKISITAGKSEISLMLFDHIDLRVSNFSKARTLYDALLPAMGYSEIAADPEAICYYRPGGDRSNPFLGLVLDPLHRPNGTRLALRASDRPDVDRLAEIARLASAGAFEPPHVCEEYTPFYYAAFFEDADGNKLEICFRKAPAN